MTTSTDSSSTAPRHDVHGVPELFDYAGYESRIDELAARYRSNQPFPHFAFDGFLTAAAAARIAEEFPTEPDEHWIRYRHFNENKASTHHWEDFPPTIRAVVQEMNSPRFLALLSRITGIEGLMADPEIEGGGMHQSWRGGFLNVHTDFTMHRGKPKWRRRCNLIFYANKDWDPRWGGALEIWDSRMKQNTERIDCLLNRAVLFNTPGALHGFPEPLTCPDGQSRKSLQWYYYTLDETADSVATTYYPRPADPLGKRIAVRLDNLALRAYAWAKRNLGLSDDVVSRVLSKLPSRKNR